MSRILRRFDARAEHLEDERKLVRILLETGDEAPKQAKRTGTDLAVDGIRLRGIPAIGRGVRGAVHRTVPHDVE